MAEFINLDRISGDFSNVCRICCNSKVSMVSIFAAHLSRKVMTLASVQVWESDGLPGQMCSDCIVKLDVSYKFKKQCERSDYILRRKKVQIEEARNIIHSNVMNPAKSFELLECTPDLRLASKQSNVTTLGMTDQSYHYDRDSLTMSLMNVGDIHSIKHEKSFEITYKCNVCCKVFGSKTKLTKHIPIHSRCKPYQCGICKKSFTTNSNLKAHSKLHSEERPFSCHICQKGCKRIKDLELHIRRHTGERPYSCDICGKSFASSSNLKAHTRTHTGEKPYICSVCQKAFCQSNELSKHRKIHTKEKRACDICNKTFNGESALIIHVMSHDEDKTNTCNVCFKNFMTSSSLAEHLQMNHIADSDLYQKLDKSLCIFR